MIQAAKAFLIGLLVLLAPAWARAAPAAAVFDFELDDTSLGGEIKPPRADEQQRIALISRELRRQLAESGKARVVDIGPVEARAHAVHLQYCGGCDADLARDVGGTLAVTGTVHKVSDLILNMRIYIREVRSGRVLAAMNADMRGNTDESWSRTLAWLVRHRLLPALEGVRE